MKRSLAGNRGGYNETLIPCLQATLNYITETTKLASIDSPNYVINLSGADNEGIVHTVTDILTSMGVNIIEVITDTQNAPITGTTLFHMVAKLNLTDNVDKLSDKLFEIQTNLGLDIKLEKI